MDRTLIAVLATLALVGAAAAGSCDCTISTFMNQQCSGKPATHLSHSLPSGMCIHNGTSSGEINTDCNKIEVWMGSTCSGTAAFTIPADGSCFMGSEFKCTKGSSGLFSAVDHAQRLEKHLN
eukprot:NODE_2791_length_502_cov_79.957333_g2741_i0.p1 GENE.NODE_2791_length_502_cov_79.957333_g2741_i0~~NODE_2791_length_502_cov_79.957333_g2741_i0.p1  ORF type:complete len:122 (+),score=28.87 NODE_2791_length_502_cov_79.957333_g2741_i0:81-446(+)